MAAEKERVPVKDPFGAARDPRMPFLAQALDPYQAGRRLEGCLTNGDPGIGLRSIRVVRHKPGRRCLIEYEVEAGDTENSHETIKILGKVRARGVDEKSYRIQRALREAGFVENPGIPETLGMIPEFRMWLQCGVTGETSTGLLADPEGKRIARRTAELAHTLHQARVPPLRPPHRMRDELRILHERLYRIAGGRPDLENRLRWVLEACDRLGAEVPESIRCGIHRDFYPDQVLVDGDRLWLLDLDLYCEGDPALDIGNFLGHIKEQSLRTLGDPAALSEVEGELVECFLGLSPIISHKAIDAYTTLTLARHVYISTRFTDRRDFTEPHPDPGPRRVLSRCPRSRRYARREADPESPPAPSAPPHRNRRRL